MIYVITDGKRYIALDKYGKPFLSSIKYQAKTWRTEEKAKNFIRGCLKNFPKLNIEEINEEDLVPTDIKEYDGADTLTKRVSELRIQIKEMESEKDSLYSELSRLDKEVEDLVHYAEFYNLNAAKGYELYKKLHKTRVKRREVKDKLKQLEILYKCDFLSEKLLHTEKSLIGIKNQKYTPRALYDLFV